MTGSKPKPQLGHSKPRLHSPNRSEPSRVGELVELADAIGLPLLPWQTEVATEALRIGGDGLWLRKLCGLTVARQNGKSHLMRMIILGHLFLWESERIVSMAQNRSLALDHFKETVSIIEGVPWLRSRVARVVKTNGQEALELRPEPGKPRGASWSLVAATQESPRGQTADLLWVDELREISEPAWTAARPMTRARKRSQIWVTSNAGDRHSTVLNTLRAAGLQSQDPALGWWEWSADPALPVTDQLAWAQANPALGHLIPPETIELELQTEKPEAIMTEILCRWVDNIESAWTPGSWDSCEDRQLQLAPGRPTWLAVDVSPDRRRADLVAGQLLDDGRIAVGLVDSWVSDAAVDELKIAGGVAKWARAYEARAVAFDRYTGSSIAARLATAGIAVGDCSGASFYQACDETLSAMNSGRIAHAGQAELTAQIAACVRKPVSDGGWRIARRGASIAISAAVALVMVIHYASRPEPKAELVVI